MLARSAKSETKAPAGTKAKPSGSTRSESAAPDHNPLWESLALSPLTLQTKLAISQPDDPDGQKLYRKCDHCEEEEKLQRKSQPGESAGDTAPNIVHEVLNTPGQPLDRDVRGFMEPRFGRDFSDVRIHSDAKSIESASAVKALAYTVGQDIVMDTSRYNPATNTGRQLLAHELTHVVQQQNAGANAPQLASAGPKIAPEGSPSEREADEIAHRVLAGESVSSRALSNPAGTLSRSVRIDPADAGLTSFLDTITRLTGRTATAAGGTLALGTPVPNAKSSATVADYIQRAISATRVYTLQSGTATPSGATVRGVRSEVTSTGVTITLNRADIGTLTWTADELLSQGFVDAVAANDRTTQTFPPTTTGQTTGTNLDALLATPLPFATPALLTAAMSLIRQRVPAVANNVGLEVDVEQALRSGKGVTLAEVLRGLETNTPFRIVQEFDGDRVRATYFDPRRSAAAGEPQPLPQRSVTFLTGSSGGTSAAAPLRTQDVGMSAADVAQANASCSTATLGEIRAHITTAQNLINRTIARLNSTENLDAALTAHFGSSGPTSRGRIAANFRVILSEMDFSRHSWICNARGSGQGCTPAGVTGRTGIGQQPIQLCIEQSAPFVPRATTVLHEVVHASGIGTLGAGIERYSWQPGYPGNDPLHNADSYAQLAAAIGVAAQAPAMPAPTRPQPQVNPPGPRGSIDDESSTPAAVAVASTSPVLQRQTGHGTERMHQGIADEYRRRHGLPEGGVDEFGRRAGPTTSQIVYGAFLFPVSLTELAAMTQWQLAYTPSERMEPAAGATPPAAGPTFDDYRRARRLVLYLQNSFGLTYDYETDQSVKGDPPDPRQLIILNNNLNQLLSTFNVRGLVSGRGGRGLPTAPGGTTASLEGHVSLVASRGDFGGKRYQLERWAGADRTMGIPEAELDRQARQLWADPATGITAAANAQVTTQERVALAWTTWVVRTSIEPAFYFPREDRFYLSSFVDLNTLEGQDTARHETVHLLGGAERTRQAFITRFTTDWLRYWKPFEEGMAEYLNISSRTAGQTPPSAQGQGGLASGYTNFYRQVQRLIATPGMGRDAVVRAYLTAAFSDAFFRTWQNIVDHP